MKTIQNRSKKERVLLRSWDDETGHYGYFFSDKSDMGTDQWHINLAPGQKVKVPSYLETYMACYTRSGEFMPLLQVRLEG